MDDATTRNLDPGGDWNHGTVRINGVDMHHVREGEGPTLLLLHGWPEFWWTWHRNIPELSKHFSVVAPDFRGFGDTAREGDEEFSADGHAADILALADSLGIDRFGIVSHDAGAYVAQAIARTVPERLIGLFFFNGPHPGIGRRWVESGHVREIWYQSFHQQPFVESLVGHNRETCRIYFEAMLRHWTHSPDSLDGMIDIFIDNFMKPGNLAGGFSWYRATHPSRMALVRDGAPDLPRIEVPSRFFWGRHDPVIKADWADTIPDYFADAMVEIAEGAGHFVHFEIPGPANGRIVEFFSGLG